MTLKMKYSTAASANVIVDDVEDNPGKSNEIDIPLSKNDTTVINVEIVSGNGQMSNKYTLTILNPLNAQEMLFKRWDDIVAVNSNPKTNGGRYNITNVQWNIPGMGHKKWYAKIPSSGIYFPVEIQLADKWYHVCGEPQTLTGKVIAYPNPVTVGDNLNLQLPYYFAGGYMDVVSLAGSVTKRKLHLPSTTNTISVADWLPGVYLLNIVAPNGDTETLKVIVSN
jgi:hypothetical protein